MLAIAVVGADCENRMNLNKVLEINLRTNLKDRMEIDDGRACTKTWVSMKEINAANVFGEFYPRLRK